MWLAVLKMKFSYRVIAVSLLVATAIVGYLFWGSDLQPWYPGHRTKMETFTTVMRQRLEKEYSSIPSPGVGKSGPKTTEDCDTHPKYTLNKTVIRTYDILHHINGKMKNGVLTGHFKPEGEPIPERKIDKTYKRNPLKVILIPHSHSDPGWHKTVVGYFNDQTKPTLDNMVRKMMKYPNMTFIWAESVFLHMWWEDCEPSMQKDVLELIRRRQLEIVVGSWVVPDEANPHFYALVDQMIEGHQWLEYHMKVKPRNTWSLDPFGYSATHPYLYQRAGYDNMVILRVHERVKAMLEEKMALEFFWQQNWDNQGDGIFTQMMPYRLYNIKHTCGPDKQICLKFDFRKIVGEFSEARADPVTDTNVHSLAKLLVSEYQKKASLFRHNVLLVPLGDDFRYDRDIEWDQQYTNYQKLFNHINAHEEFNMQARFGTLQDYFDEVRANAQDAGTSLQTMFPKLEGDFFPYTDEKDEYWAGYFTSRPYFKMLGRELEVQLRAAEILHSFTVASHRARYKDFQGNMQLLEMSRRSLGLYQHHDAITGTATHYVNMDYENHLNRGLDHAQNVIKSSMKYLLEAEPAKDSDKHEFRVLDVENFLGKKMLSPHLKKFNVASDGLRLAIFNPVARSRQEIVKVIVKQNHVIVTNDASKVLPCQMNPVWLDSVRYSRDEFELSWKVDLPPLGIKVYKLLPADAAAEQICKLVSVQTSRSVTKNPGIFDMTTVVDGNDTVLENADVSLKFNKGYLDSVTSKRDQKSIKSRIRFMMYQSARSGAYIFKPQGPATSNNFESTPLYRVVRGPLFSEVQVFQKVVNHTVRLLHDSPHTQAVQIENVVDMTKSDQLELIMRLDTDLQNTDNTFFTDLNGFQVMKRKTFANFPIEANYYPSTTFIYLEDEQTRVSLISAQSLGASSQAPGSMEVMLDRRLRYDDGRGLGEGVQDNKRTPSRFYLLLEGLDREAEDVVRARLDTASYPTLRAQELAHLLRHYPIVASLGSGDVRPSYSPLRSQLPCDVHLVSLRSLKDPLRAQGSVEAALVLHRVGHDCRSQLDGESCGGSLVFTDLFGPQLNVVSIKESTLSMMHDKRKIDMAKEERLSPMQLHAYRLLLG